EVARATYNSYQAQFLTLNQYTPSENMDLIYCNGVFHHIPLDERGTAIEYIYTALRPGGLFSVWENNPWNLGTRYIMKRVPFDRDAIPVTSREMKRLICRQGFEVIGVDYLFIFPHILKWLRWIEPRVTWIPIGAQYQVLCRKPIRQ